MRQNEEEESKRFFHRPLVSSEVKEQVNDKLSPPANARG